MVYLFESGWWFSVGTGALSVFALALYVIFANYLSKETYGVYQYLLSASVIIGAFTLTGMNTSVARSIAQGYEGTLKKAVVVQLTFGAIPFLMSTIAAIYYLLNENIVLATGFLLIALFTPLLNSFNTYGAYFHGKQDFRGSFFYGLFWHVPYYLALAIAAWLSSGALILLAINLVVQTIATFFLYLFVQKKLIANANTDNSAVPFGMHLSAMNLPTIIASQIDSILAFTYLGAAPLAIYSFATAIPERLTGFLKFLPAAALPRLSNKTPEEIRKALGGGRIALIFVSILLCAGAYVLLIPSVFDIFFPQYEEAVPYSQLYSLIFISVITNIFVTGLTAERNVKNLYIFNIFTPIFQIVLQAVGIVVFGLWGLIAARILSSFISALIAAVLLLRFRPGSDSVT